MSAEPKVITIHEQDFAVSAPYVAGYTLNEAEARALNQTRAENIANNFRKRIKAAVDGVALKEGAAIESLDAVRADFAKYDTEYTFSMPSVGRGEPIDPLEREAYRLARELVRKAIAAQGKKLKEIDEDKLEAKIAEVAATEGVVKEAKRRLKAAETAFGEITI